MKYLPHIGLRKAKSLLAIFVGFWLWQFVRLFFPSLEVHPLFIYIYGVLEIRDNSQKTVELGTVRIKATLVGISLALPVISLTAFLTHLMPATWMATGVGLLFILLGTLVALLIAERVGCKSFCGVAAIIYIILMIYHSGDDRYIYSVLRAFQTIVGVGIAWLINVKLWPYPKKEDPKST